MGPGARGPLSGPRDTVKTTNFNRSCCHVSVVNWGCLLALPSLLLASCRMLGPGLAEVDVKPSTNGNNGLFCTVERTNPTNPVRNIRLLMPGFDTATADALPFHPRFVASLKPYGVLRFMDLMKANAPNGPKTWGERSQPTDR